MSHHKRGTEAFEKVLNYLADSILHESDECMFAEVGETNANLQTAAEYTRSKLRAASDALRSVHRRLSNLGHAVDPNWQYRRGEYHSICLNCGATLSFRTSSHESEGVALQTRCVANDEYIASGQAASRK